MTIFFENHNACFYDGRDSSVEKPVGFIRNVQINALVVGMGFDRYYTVYLCVNIYNTCVRTYVIFPYLLTFAIARKKVDTIF